ncbi:sensor histidine kinase [Janthinobacterium agaricidamnosum]|uniref:Histidine kinase-, DNA gyrase B-, and HSP90-like ATPase family protein n=1 Tax=Janthinobacterium agaricidamnosum NBRC 102515 = DSM 9628 TaxID=1349767 RepID=W0VAZ3_9BURK|nr:CHASE domain-containing protein [Janthinobacterium agaricidamnosum]CDG84805.1 histidine kinase-, DNA gyrase B-, and HSP90-like ATPase family protein [Janthinobacterium agaricidamnosum NBRC 102515 = DSM 9628]
MHSLPGKKIPRTPGKPLWWTGILLSALVGLLFYVGTTTSIEADSQQRFNDLSSNAQYSINARIKSYADLLRGAASLFHASDTVSRKQFHHYVASLALPVHFPAIETINFATHVTDAGWPAFAAAMRKEEQGDSSGYPPFTLHPPGKRDSYAILTLMEPMASAPANFGLDLAATPYKARVIYDARDRGVVNNSGQPIMVPNKPSMTGLAMRMPVYRAGLPLENVEQRRAAYIGSIGIGFNLQVMIHSVLQEMPLQDMRLALYDGGPLTDSNGVGRHLAPLFDNRPPPQPSPWWHPSSNATFNATLPIDYNGRLWHANFSILKSDLYTSFDTYFPLLSMLAGFTGCMLMYALFHTLSSSRMRAIQMARDMTRELRDSQEKLQISHQKLRRLAAHADQIKEEERKRIAREIHDDLGQNLLVLRIEADMLASRTEGRHPRLNARARSTLGQIDLTIKSVRQIINDLRPNVLDLGLSAAVEWQVAQFQNRTGIVCEFNESQADICLNDHCATAFFRILQESLSNIFQHANASRVQIDLCSDGDTLSMTVQDNGVGAADGGRSKAGSFGLVGIEERIKLLGGELAIHSSQGAGMTIHVSVPIKGGPAYPYVEHYMEYETSQHAGWDTVKAG